MRMAMAAMPRSRRLDVDLRGWVGVIYIRLLTDIMMTDGKILCLDTIDGMRWFF